MTEKPFRALGKTLVEATRAYDPEKPTGRLGCTIAGVNRIIDPKDSNYFLVRLDRVGTFVRALHRGRVTPDWNLAVELIKIRKGNREYYEITGTNVDEQPSQGGDYAGLQHVGPHHHLRGTDMEINLDPRQVGRLKALSGSGLVITVTAGFYWAGGSLHWFPGDTLNVSTGVPDTASQHRWGIVALDLLTQALVLLTGDSKVILQPLTSADLPDIDLLSHLPLAAVKLRYGMTNVQELDFDDLRFIFGTDGITSLVLRDAVDKTISSGVITVGEGEAILRIAPETGSADTLSQIDITGKPRLLYLLPAEGATITVQHAVSGGDNIYLSAGDDFDMSGQQALELLFDGVAVKAVSAGTGGGAVAVDDGTTAVDPAALLSFDGEYFEVIDGGTNDALITSTGKLPVSTGDTTPALLENKLEAGTNISITKVGTGGNEKLRFSATPGGGVGTSNITLGSYADPRPATPNNGDMFIARDGYYDYEVWDGTAWVAFKNGMEMVVPPAASGFAWVNQGGATVDDSLGAWVVSAPDAAAFNWRVLKIAAPATPYVITLAVMAFVEGIALGADQGVGLTFRQSSDGKLASNNLFRSASTGTFFTGMSLLVHKWTNPTTNSANYGQYNVPYLPQVVWLRITDDGTDRKCFISTDGKNWTQAHTVGRTDFMTADEVGVIFGANASQASTSVLLSWEVT